MLVCPHAEIRFWVSERYQISSCQTAGRSSSSHLHSKGDWYSCSDLSFLSSSQTLRLKQMYFQDVSPSCLCRGGPSMRPQCWNLSPDELRFQNTAQSCQETGGFCKLQWLLVKFYPFSFCLNISFWFYCTFQVLHHDSSSHGNTSWNM